MFVRGYKCENRELLSVRGIFYEYNNSCSEDALKAPPPKADMYKIFLHFYSYIYHKNVSFQGRKLIKA